MNVYENVGVLAAQSIGEKVTQLTLNSVDGDTEIIIECDGKIMTPKIGEWIDQYYTNCPPERVQHLDNQQLYISLDGDGHDWKAYSCDEEGRMKWTRLEAITRHPVMNDDGTDTILEVELQSGRCVRATRGLSFLTLKDGRIQQVRGDSLRVGDVLPVAATTPTPPVGTPFGDTLFEPITAIRHVRPRNGWVYDITVAETRNFCCANGINMADGMRRQQEA